jgi:hypothetical protein
MNARLDRYGTWLLWFVVVVTGAVILSSVAYALTSQTGFSTLGGPIGSTVYFPGFDAWTGQPFHAVIVQNGGGQVRVAWDPGLVGRWAVPVPVGFVVGCLITLAALAMSRPAKVVMAAIVSILAPIAALPIVIFTDHPTTCPAGAGYSGDPVSICGSRVLQAIDPIVWQAALAALGIAWLAATVALVIYLVRIDPGRLVRASAVAVLVAFLAASAGFVMGTGLTEGVTPRLGDGAQIGMQSGMAILLVGLVITIARAAIMARSSAEI